MIDKYLESLENDRDDLTDAIREKGVEVGDNQTFTALVEKVGEIESGGLAPEVQGNTLVFESGASINNNTLVIGE